jgi:hypothetical protein
MEIKRIFVKNNSKEEQMEKSIHTPTQTLLNIPDSARATSGEQDEKNLSSKYLPLWIQVIGTIYFCLSLIGGIILIVTSTETHTVYTPGLFSREDVVTTVNYFYRSMGIVGIISSLVVLLICLGVAKIIEQNIFIINKIKEK